MTLQSEHKSIVEAFAALQGISVAMARTGAPSDVIELLVVDEDGHQVAARTYIWEASVVLQTAQVRQR